jgi:hypothetical protein
VRARHRFAFMSSLTTAVVCAAPAFAADEPKRELGAHEHGHNALDVVIEGNRVVIEFRAPGADIIGSETKPTTQEGKAVLAAAIATWQNPLTLFVLPAAAQCTVASATADLVADDDDDDDKDKAAKTDSAKPTAEPKAADAHAHHDEHMDFKASYELACTNPAGITSLEIAYFKTFPKAQKVTVQVITAKGQTAMEATPAKPSLDFRPLVK